MTGALKKHPERSRPHEPKSGKPLGPAPDHLTEAERAVWDEIAEQVVFGVMESSDRFSFETLVKLATRMRADFDNFGGRQLMTMIQLFTRFGMTPADRSRVTVPSGNENKKDPAKEFFG